MRRTAPSSSIAGDALPPPAFDFRDKLLLALLTAGCVLAILAGWFYCAVEARLIENAAMRTTFAVAEGKVLQISNWRFERFGDGNALIASANIARGLLSPASGESADKAMILDLMRRLAEFFRYSDALVADANGNTRLELDSRSAQRDLDYGTRVQLIREAISSGRVIVSDLIVSPVTGRPFMYVTAPIGQAGAFVLQIEPDRFLYPYLASWPGGGRSGEALLVRREGNYIVDVSPHRFAGGPPMMARRRIAYSLPPDSELEKGWSTTGRDYRNVPVIATVRRIPGSMWYLIAKMDKSEAVEPIHRLAIEAVLLTLCLGFVNIAGGIFIFRRRNEQVRQHRVALFSAIANKTPAYLWLESSGEDARFMNDPLRTFLGEEAVYWIDRLSPEDQPRVRAVHDEAMRRHRSYSETARIRRADGELRLIAVHALPQFSVEGEFTGLAGSLVDETDRISAEDKLRVANERLTVELAESRRKEQEIRELGARLIGAREEERARLSRELHDGVNQQVAAIAFTASILKRELTDRTPGQTAQIEKIQDSLSRLADSIRTISHELHPALLSMRRLDAAVRSCCGEFEGATGIETSLRTTGSFGNEPPAAALCIYRILQEALQNVSRHAGAASVAVELNRTEDQIVLTVRDSGAGFDPEAPGTRKGLGLISMEERARLAGGAVTIKSAPGTGTTVRACVPVQARFKAPEMYPPVFPTPQ